jgi:hypothetical protein
MSWYWWLLIGLWIGAPLGFLAAGMLRAGRDLNNQLDSVLEYKYEPHRGTPTDGSPRREP